MNKRQLTELLEEFFSSQPGRTFSFKEIFRTLHLDTHPLKMLAIDIMEEMTWEEFLVRVTDSSYRLNDSGQVQEGRFVRKQNGKTLSYLTAATNPSSCRSATRWVRSAATG